MYRISNPLSLSNYRASCPSCQVLVVHRFFSNTEIITLESILQVVAILCGFGKGEIRDGDVKGFVKPSQQSDCVTTVLVVGVVDSDDDYRSRVREMLKEGGT
jgi:hypothetical protein